MLSLPLLRSEGFLADRVQNRRGLKSQAELLGIGLYLSSLVRAHFLFLATSDLESSAFSSDCS